MPKNTAKFQETMRKKKEEKLKNIKDSTLKAVTPTISYSEYYDFNIMQQKLFTNNTAEQWSRELVEFAKRPDVIKITEFFVEKGISYSSFMNLCKDYELLKEAYEHARFIVGIRREKGGVKNEFNAGLIHISQAIYDPEWKANAEWKAKLTLDNNKAGPVTVLIERYPNTAIVPEKIKVNNGE